MKWPPGELNYQLPGSGYYFVCPCCLAEVVPKIWSAILLLNPWWTIVRDTRYSFKCDPNGLKNHPAHCIGFSKLLEMLHLLLKWLPGSAGGVRGIGGSVEQYGSSWLAWVWSQSEASLAPWQESGSTCHMTLLSHQVVRVSAASQRVWRRTSSGSTRMLLNPWLITLWSSGGLNRMWLEGNWKSYTGLMGARRKRWIKPQDKHLVRLLLSLWI